MKKVFAVLCMILSLLLSLPVYASVPDADDISAQAAILMDAETGQVLYEKNAAEQRQPASITKIMTAMLVLENLDTDATLTASEKAVDMPSWSSSAYIKAGERLTVEEAMYALMLRSANEAANILAEEIAGSQSGFADMMNERALELGAADSHFTNAHGLSGKNHYTTAYDMAIITRQAVRTPGFLTYFGAPTYYMDETNESGARAFTHTHRMLLSNYSQYREEVIGGKTGYTMPAGYTLVTVAERDGRTLICVVMKSESMYADTGKLLDFGFDEFIPYTYTFTDSPTSIEVPILDGDWEAGRAYLTYPDSASMLIHESVDPMKIAEEYVYPEITAAGDEIKGEVELRLPGADGIGLPGTLLSIPLKVQITEFEPPVVEVVAGLVQEKPEDAGFGVLHVVLIMLAVAVIPVCLVLFQKRRTKRRVDRYRRVKRYHGRTLLR